MARQRLGTASSRPNDLVSREEVRKLTAGFGTFADVSQVNINQNIPKAEFTTVQLSTENVDAGTLFDPATSFYRVPETGIYTCEANVRIPDGDLRLQNIGLGIHASNFDGPWFRWNITRIENMNPTRQSFAYQRTTSFVKDDLLRLYVWSGEGIIIERAQMTIVRSSFL